MAKTLLQCTDKPELREIAKILDAFNYKWDRYTILCDIFEASAIAISNQTDVIHSEMWNRREQRYKDIMNKYSLEDRRVIVDVFNRLSELLSGMHENGFDDYLGKLYMMSGTSSDKNGQFFTPYHVSKACAEITITEQKIEANRKSGQILKIHEPTCGSGGMILAAVGTMWNRYNFNYTENVLVCCGDIDTRCVHMTYIQLSLAGVPAVVKHQNALTLETWDEWHTPALKMQYMKFRRYLK